MGPNHRVCAPAGHAFATALCLLALAASARAAPCNFTVANNTCIGGGTYSHYDARTPADCCAACSADTQCDYFTFNTVDLQEGKACRLKHGMPGTDRTASQNCTSGTHTPPPPPPAPPIPPPSPPNPNAPRPHFVFILADDLGFYDTAVYNPLSPTPTLANLTKQGIRLDRHYVFRYCSPTRRSFLSGRLPNKITTVQPDGNNLCSDFLPLAVDILPEKLATTGAYDSYFVGKGHEGYQTTDHLPVNRGFKTHVGYLGGAESYFGGYRSGTSGNHDMWHDMKPGTDVVDDIYYSANFYTSTAVRHIRQHNQSRSMFLYLPIQSVHSPYQLPPDWEVKDYPEMWDHTYANMLHMLDSAVANVTQALVETGMWKDTLVVFTADNGGVGKFGNNYPLRGHKHDPWEGGTRSTAFVSGGFVPESLRGTASGAKLIHVSDWYATFCTLAGVDPRNDVYLDGKVRPIDGVNVWPMLTGANVTQPRVLTPTTESSIIEATPATWWKLVNLAGNSNYYGKNDTQTPGTDPCLAACQPDPVEPGRTDPIVNGCPVCNATHPCLYDLLVDPLEQHNVAAQHMDVVSRLLPTLVASNDHYVSGRIPADQLARDYEPVPSGAWGDYLGPCYQRRP